MKNQSSALQHRLGRALVVLVILSGAPLSAQTITTNPRTLVFSPSADHNTVVSDGNQAVERYDLRFFYLGASQPFQTTSVGKPSPAADGLIHLDLATAVTVWPLNAGTTFEARVAAIGTGGTGESAPSNPFAFTASCTYTLSTTALSMPSPGATTSVAIVAPAGCAWSAASNAAWITLAGTSAGTGSGSVAVSVAANQLSTTRSATLTIAGRTVTVTQGATAPVTVTSLTSSVGFPTPVGTPITWTATAAGGTGPYSYEFWLYDGVTWALARGWGESNRWTWQPSRKGSYVLQVWVRSAGATTAYDAWRQTTAAIAPPRALSVSSVIPSSTVATAGQPVTWTATATGGVGPYQFQFWVFDGARWRVGQDWSPSSTWPWTPPTPGTYAFQVWVRNAGSSARLDAYSSFGPYTAQLPTALSATALSADRATPMPADTPITWTAVASGGIGPYTYQFRVWNGSTWSVGRDWSPAPVWTWIPSTPGTYSVQVSVRNAGSTATDDTRLSAPYTVENATTLTVTDFVADRSFPVPRNTPVTWTASAEGGTGPYTYKFYVYDGVSWHVGQDWSASGTWTWVPASAGTYVFQVWVRNAGSSADYDAYRSSGAATIGGATPLAVTTLSVSPMVPLVTGAPAVVTATAAGGTGPYAYKFWVFDGVNWSVGQSWSASNAFTWTPPAAGAYNIQVWVKRAGSSAAWEAFGSLRGLNVIP